VAAELRVALIGLDTSHAVEFPRRMQAPDCPAGDRVPGLRAVTCLRFETPFQDARGLDLRQEQLEAWGVRVTTSFEQAVADCDAIMIEINDAAPHVQWFERCASLGKPVFLDKPLADTVAGGRRILQAAARAGTRFFSSSSLRFVAELEESCGRVPAPRRAGLYGPLGRAPAGSSIVWYGVHAFEMLERAMGRGARTVRAMGDASDAVFLVDYGERRCGVVELTEGAYVYGGSLRAEREGSAFTVDTAGMYSALLRRIQAFFGGGPAPASPEDALEVLAMLEAAEKALATGRAQEVAA
jgi:predicted dehydrogenase